MPNRFTKGQGFFGAIVAQAARIAGPLGVAGNLVTIADGGSMALTAANVVTDRLIQSTPTANRNVASPTAAQIIALLPPNSTNTAYEFTYASLAAFTLTLTAGTGVTLVGSAVVANSSTATWAVVQTGAAAVTIFRK